jgi:hypothetical protein
VFAVADDPQEQVQREQADNDEERDDHPHLKHLLAALLSLCLTPFSLGEPRPEG